VGLLPGLEWNKLLRNISYIYNVFTYILMSNTSVNSSTLLLERG